MEDMLVAEANINLRKEGSVISVVSERVCPLQTNKQTECHPNSRMSHKIKRFRALDPLSQFISVGSVRCVRD